MKLARSQDGFTLVEMLVAMAMTVVVFGATLTVVEAFQQDNRFDQLRNENQDNARTTLDRLSKQLRNVIARVTSNGIVPGALEEAEPYSITFQTVETTKAPSGKNENLTNAMRVRYCLEDSNPTNEILWEQVQHWESAQAPERPTATACPDNNNGDWNSSTRVVEHVTNEIGGRTNEPLFAYSAQETPEILSVEMDIFTNVNPGHSRPGESQLTSGISLRNANRKPIVSFSVTPKNGSFATLNASASQDPDGLALTYKWEEGSTVLESTAQQFETSLTQGTHIYKLEVTNPGGLSACGEVSGVTSSSSTKESSEISCPI